MVKGNVLARNFRLYANDDKGGEGYALTINLEEIEQSECTACPEDVWLRTNPRTV